MGVALRVGTTAQEIGSPDFLHAFFSTISGNLEPEGWGSRFPELMGSLYQGSIGAKDALNVLENLETIRRELKELPPDRVIWDIDNPEVKPPWRDQISADVTDLSNYFVTSDGQDLIEVLTKCLQSLRQSGGSMTVE